MPWLNVRKDDKFSSLDCFMWPTYQSEANIHCSELCLIMSHSASQISNLLSINDAPDGLPARQFRLTPTGSNPPSANSVNIGNFTLDYADGLTLCKLTDADDTDIGYLYGELLDLVNCVRIGNTYKTPHRIADGPDTFLKGLTADIAGRWLLFMNTGSYQRVYTDTLASIPCVYDAKARSLGSTANTLLDNETYADRLNQNLFQALTSGKIGYITYGLTAHNGINRLLSGRYLDLNTFSIHRYWPLKQSAVIDDLDAAVDEYTDIVRRYIRTLVEAPDVTPMVALTGGSETRVMLTSVKPFVDQVSFMTVVGNANRARDTFITEKLAKRFNLDHHKIALIAASDEERLKWLRLNGHVNGEANAMYFPSMAPLRNGKAFVGGIAGEMGRASMWRDSDTPDTPLNARDLIARLGMPFMEEFEAPCQAWMETLPEMDAYGILDQAYVELNLTNWCSTQFYGDPTVMEHHSMMTRRQIEIMQGLPAEWKRNNRLTKEVIKRHWPELDEIPLNKWGDYRDYLEVPMMAVRKPRLILKKLRKLFG